jgi:hypothetical protein
MPEPGERLGLGAEAGTLGVLCLPAEDHLEGDKSFEGSLAGAVGDAHAAAAEHVQDFVTGNERQLRPSRSRSKPYAGPADDARLLVPKLIVAIKSLPAGPARQRAVTTLGAVAESHTPVRGDVAATFSEM